MGVADNTITAVYPCDSHPVSQGKLCIKGWQGHEFIQSPDRLMMPLIRQGDQFREASWDEAYDLIAGKLQRIKNEFGSDSIALLSSAKCTNEENYLLQKFARAVIGTNNIDHCARL